MKKKNLIFLTIEILVSITTFGQQGLPLKFGIDLDGKLKKTDPNKYYDSPTGVVYVGAFAEYFVTNHFSGKLKAGLNNTYLHQDYVSFLNGGTGELMTYSETTKVTQTMEIGLEPRFYFFSTEQSRKGNLFAALPVMYETKTLGENKYIFRSKFMIVPTLGVCYNFTGHWGIEAIGGLGWRKYGKYKSSQGMTSSEVEYGLTVGIRYCF